MLFSFIFVFYGSVIRISVNGKFILAGKSQNVNNLRNLINLYCFLT